VSRPLGIPGELNKKMGVIEELRDDFRFYRNLKPTQGTLETLTDRCFLVSANYRFGYWACRVRTPAVGKLLRLTYLLSNALISSRNGTNIRSGAVIGRRFEVHTTFGIEIADGVIIGDDCSINGGVCVANRANGRGEGVPRIGNHVTLGLGCKVLGGITIGDNVSVGANAVVLRDVPPTI